MNFDEDYNIDVDQELLDIDLVKTLGDKWIDREK